MSDFETFTREKIVRLRAEAEALEKILKEFGGTRARSGASPGKASAPATGAFGTILEALGAAGPTGLSLDEMIEAAAARDMTVNRATLRSQLWSAKNNERVEQIEPGRYRSSTPNEFEGVKIEPPTNTGLGDRDDYSSGFRTAPPSQPAPTIPSPEKYDINDDIPF